MSSISYMKVLLDLGPNIHQAAKELHGIKIGQLMTPLTRYSDQGLEYGIDNGAFSRFNRDAFISLLERQSKHKDRCLFVAAPDVVGSARRTLEVFERWKERLSGWPISLVAQDGVEDLEIPWDWISGIFIGGTDTFKISRESESVVKAAKILGKHVHVGRVNTRQRFERFSELGADTCDGTGICRFSHMRQSISDNGGLFE